MPLVRYVGQPNLLGSKEEAAAAQELIRAGKLTKHAVWAANAKRRTAIPYVDIRVLGPSEGLSRLYVWGKEPDTYVQEVTPDDWTRIQRFGQASDFVTMDGSLEDARAALRAEFRTGRWRG